MQVLSANFNYTGTTVALDCRSNSKFVFVCDEEGRLPPEQTGAGGGVEGKSS